MFQMVLLQKGASTQTRGEVRAGLYVNGTLCLLFPSPHHEVMTADDAQERPEAISWGCEDRKGLGQILELQGASSSMQGQAGQEQGQSLGWRQCWAADWRAGGGHWVSPGQSQAKTLGWGRLSGEQRKAESKFKSTLWSPGHTWHQVVMKMDFSDLRAESPHGALGTEPCPPNYYVEALIPNILK